MGWKRKHGAFANITSMWTAYRYGSAPTTKVRRRILTGQQREHVVERVVEILKGYRLSPFEFEGPTRAGLRAGFCLGGERWALSDLEADEIVQEGLRRIGVKQRPTPWEGQPEVTDSNVFCRWCGIELTEEMFAGSRIGIFCSDECGAASFVRRRTRDNWYENEASRKAYRASLKTRRPTRNCQQCGKPFHPERTSEKNIYCSPTCHAKSKIKTPIHTCLECGTEFRPQSTKIGKFCSNECRRDNEKKKNYKSECAYCGDAFQAKTAKAKYCSSNHASLSCAVLRRIKEAERTGVPFVPNGKNKAFAQRIIDAHLAEKAKVGPSSPPPPVHILHELLDVARRAPALHRPLTAAVFDQCFARAA